MLSAWMIMYHDTQSLPLDQIRELCRTWSTAASDVAVIVPHAQTLVSESRKCYTGPLTSGVQLASFDQTSHFTADHQQARQHQAAYVDAGAEIDARVVHLSLYLRHILSMPLSAHECLKIGMLFNLSLIFALTSLLLIFLSLRKQRFDLGLHAAQLILECGGSALALC